MSAQIDSPAIIGISGSSGLVGSALARELTTAGERVVPIRRRQPPAWGFSATDAELASMSAVVHLAGEPIASGRWTAAKMASIRRSRVEGTRSLCEALAGLERPPRVLLCASAIGIYGDRGDETLDETSGPGDSFLAEVAQDWQAAARPAFDRGIRTAFLRFGMVLSPQGGALAKMLAPFRLGLGGRIGSGRQWWSWIALDDAVGAVCHLLATAELSGPVNVVAPGAVTNAEFTAALGRALGRPTPFPIPSFAARLAFGRMADELLLASARVVPRRLVESGFAFRHADIGETLCSMLANEVRPAEPRPASG